MSNTPEENRRIRKATKKAKEKYAKLQLERENDMKKVYLNDNNNTIILTSKKNDSEEVKKKYINLRMY